MNRRRAIFGIARVHASDAWRVAAFLAVSGGFQDAYSYLARGGVFANAQTGNIVLLCGNLAHGDAGGALRFVLPLAAFTLGAFAAAMMRRRDGSLHWRQRVLVAEVALLAAAGFVPHSLDFAANALVSFACAMQVQAFRKIHGNAYASTMCIGNLRAFAEWTGRAVGGCASTRTGCRRAWLRAERYLGIIALFALGATLGALAVPRLGIHSIWISCGLLAVASALMFERNERRAGE